jgi:aspartyl-tRNA synthetase
MSFITQEDIKNLIEGLLKFSWPEHLLSPTFPFQRMSYDDAIRLYGCDKPDTRYDAQVIVSVLF